MCIINAAAPIAMSRTCSSASWEAKNEEKNYIVFLSVKYTPKRIYLFVYIMVVNIQYTFFLQFSPPNSHYCTCVMSQLVEKR